MDGVDGAGTTTVRPLCFDDVAPFAYLVYYCQATNLEENNRAWDEGSLERLAPS
jgi:hypothetical protein